MKDKKHCCGCRDNFYNGNNDIGVKECWHFKGAKLVWRKKVPLDMRPPWKMPAVQVPDCRHDDGYVYMDAKKERWS